MHVGVCVCVGRGSGNMGRGSRGLDGVVVKGVVVVQEEIDYEE